MTSPLVGATPRRPDVVAGVLRGEVPAFGVNPNYSDVLGLPCVPSVAAIPDPPEMAILLVEQYYDFARSLADRYVVLSRGEVVKAGRGADMDADGVRACLTV